MHHMHAIYMHGIITLHVILYFLRCPAYDYGFHAYIKHAMVHMVLIIMLQKVNLDMIG